MLPASGPKRKAQEHVGTNEPEPAAARPLVRHIDPPRWTRRARRRAARGPCAAALRRRRRRHRAVRHDRRGPVVLGRERRAGLDALLAAGIPPQRIAGRHRLRRAAGPIELTRHAIAAGCAAALVLPPFFFKDVTDEGVYAAYARLIEGVGDAAARCTSTTFRRSAASPFRWRCCRALAAAYPGIVAGVKDSSGNFDNTRALLAARARNCRSSSATSRTCRRCASRRRGNDLRRRQPLSAAGAAAVRSFARPGPGRGPRADRTLPRGNHAVPAFRRVQEHLQAELTGDAAGAQCARRCYALSTADARALHQAVAAAGIVPERDGAGPR